MIRSNELKTNQWTGDEQALNGGKEVMNEIEHLLLNEIRTAHSVGKRTVESHSSKEFSGQQIPCMRAPGPVYELGLGWCPVVPDQKGRKVEQGGKTRGVCV